MSKDIAQTVGGKRFAWLVALLAVFAVLASAQLAPGSASAAGTGDGTLSAPADTQDAFDPQLPTLNPGLYHVNATGTALLTIRDVENNVIGFEHAVCLVVGTVDNDAIEDDLAVTGFGGIIGVIGNPALYNWRIQTLVGQSDIVGAAKVEMDFAQYANGNDLPCVRWWSSGPGEQNITVVDGTGSVAADWADGGVQTNATDADVCTDADANSNCDQLPLSSTNATPVSGLANTQPVVKEWNLLVPTAITRAGTTTPNLDGTTITVGAMFNPATSRYIAPATALDEWVLGQHTTQGGAVIGPIAVAGAKVTFTAAGTCGLTIVDPALNTTLEGSTGATADINGAAPPPPSVGPWALAPGQSVTVTSIGVAIRFHVVTDNCTVLGGMNHTTTIQVDYPTNIGSQNPPRPPAETIRVVWTGTIAEKKVLLAWAGQRILLEYDWRLPPGGIDPDGFPGDNEVVDPPTDTDILRCPWTIPGLLPVVFVSKWLRQSGPGTFLSNNELGAFTSIADLLLDLISPDELNVISSATSCVSRAVYESNPPGQVDITLQVTDVCIGDIPGAGIFHDCDFDPLNQTKVDFVIYFMKFEDVKLSLVTSVSKPTHNSSLAGWNDYSPGNPWDASTDVTTTEWNVSRDLLVRGRVRGWFVNENPSGRARDDSDPLNVRPIDRWILPDDWAILAGGPADPADGSDARGTAEEFRPYYDLMIAPNNTSGLALQVPNGGTGFPQVSTVATVAGFTNTASTFAVAASANLVAGATIAVPSVGSSGGAGVCVTPGASVIQAGSPTPILNGAGNVIGVAITVSPALCATPAAGAPIFLYTVPFEGPLSLIDLPGFNTGAAPSNLVPGVIRDTTFKDGDVDMWDAPMPVAPVSVKIRGAGFIKQVMKSDVYYLGTVNSAAQVYPNPYYITNIPAEPWLSAISAGGGFLWDSWALDGPGGAGQGVYTFWQFARRDANIVGVGDALTNTERAELQAIRDDYGDQSITRDAVVYSDNHGEFMVTANGDFKLDYSGCATNAIAGGKHCKPGDKVGSSTITATVDYPEFRGKHPPVASNAVTVDWTWGGYKDVTIEDGETPQFKYIVFHAMDRDGFCWFDRSKGTRSLHPVLTSLDALNKIGTNDPDETVDFLIDAGEGIIVGSADNGSINQDGNRQFATGVKTFSTAINTVHKEFPFSPLAAAEATDECQAWVKVSNSLLGIVNFLVVAHDDEGNIGFDRIVDLQGTATYTLNFRWSLVTWNGADNIPVTDALAGTGANEAGNDISGEVTAVYGWEQSSQDWLGYFPSGVSVPGANDLTSLKIGSAYWIAIKAPGPVTWTYATNVD